MTRLRCRQAVTAFVHQSDETRVVSQKLTERLVGLGETPGIFCDRAMDVAGIQVIRIFGEEGEANPEQIKRLAAESLQSGRVIFDVDATLDLQRAYQGFEAAEQVFWCVTPGNWEASLSRLHAIEARAQAGARRSASFGYCNRGKGTRGNATPRTNAARF